MSDLQHIRMMTAARRTPAWCTSVVTTVLLATGIVIGVVIIVAHLGAHAAGNLAACRDYEQQRAWVKGLSAPTLADAAQFASDLGSDAAMATGQLAIEFSGFYAAEQAVQSGGPSPVTPLAASEQVYGACTALGVQFSPAA
jgi:hypothetical protein